MLRTVIYFICFLMATLRTGHANENASLHVFIHVCTINHWQEILDRQLALIKDSGLYDQCASISLGVLGRGDIKRYTLKYPKLEILFQDPDINKFERPTLLTLHKFCLMHPDAFVLYLHTKGVTRFGEVKNNVNDWSRYMEYFAVECWEDCVDALQDYDVCGVNWGVHPPHFSGNFWWATAKYISKLPNFIGEGYLDPEFWIGKMFPKVKCFHRTHGSHYENPYPPSKYKAPSNPYVLALIPEGPFGKELKNYWDTVIKSLETPEWEIPPITNALPLCKLTSEFASEYRKDNFKKALQDTLDLMWQDNMAQKIRVINLIQGSSDYIQIKSPFLRQCAKAFAERLTLPTACVEGVDKDLFIVLRENKGKNGMRLEMQVLQKRINLQAEAKWSLGICKINGDQLTLLVSCPINQTR